MHRKENDTYVAGQRLIKRGTLYGAEAEQVEERGFLIETLMMSIGKH